MTMLGCGVCGQQLPQHVRQNSAVLVVVHLDRRIDTQQQLRFLPGAVASLDDHGDVLLRLDVAVDAEDMNVSSP